MRRMIKKVSLLLLVLVLLTGLAMAQPLDEEGWEEVFSMADPQGDSIGPGDYTYPQHPSFPQELPQMLDLTAFRVVNTLTSVRFEFQFAQRPDLHQPWGGAGFNFHRIDLYIASGREGSTETFRSGARVNFRQPWQINLRLRDWKGAYLIHWQDHDPQDPRAGLWQDQVDGFSVYVDDNIIIAEVDFKLLGPAQSHWNYYVLVGIQDAYGPDQYREVDQQPGPWTGGGGCDSEFNPNLYDILAESVDSQQAQLDWDVGRLAMLDAVGPTSGTGIFFRILTIVAIVLLAGGAAVLIWVYARR
jgi:carbohydrate-binding DOMON domain-containing protein